MKHFSERHVDFKSVPALSLSHSTDIGLSAHRHRRFSPARRLENEKCIAESVKSTGGLADGSSSVLSNLKVLFVQRQIVKLQAEGKSKGLVCFVHSTGPSNYSAHSLMCESKQM
jgi:hypothetical protein